ncbi:unnamed protein product [Cuscuta campestris]|uniref:Uncharacterized protein n=1 Tax=Cuscuta campestris TaxID=132261 RepID=A0A484LLB1_9ASTE|nr:unnamed protein product [Cuscuta campestris]
MGWNVSGGTCLAIGGSLLIVITRAGAGKITPGFAMKTDPAGKSWADVSESYRDFYFREFKKRVKWSPEIDEGRMREAFLKRAAGLYSGYMYNQRTDGRVKKKSVDPGAFEALQEGWNASEFQDISKRKKKNRRKGREDGFALGTYTGGTVSFSENLNRLVAKKGTPVSLKDGIVHMKTKKHDGQSWVDPANADLWARFVTLRDEARKNGLNVTDQEIWYLLVQGHNAKNQVPRVGDYERQMRKLKPSSTRRRSSSSASSKTEIEALKEHIQRLQEQFDALTSKFTTMQENLKRLYGDNYPPQDDDGGNGGAGQSGDIC